MLRLGVYLVPVFLFLAACEDQGNEGNDNLLTGLSGLIIIVVLGLVIWRVLARKGGGE